MTPGQACISALIGWGVTDTAEELSRQHPSLPEDTETCWDDVIARFLAEAAPVEDDSQLGARFLTHCLGLGLITARERSDGARTAAPSGRDLVGVRVDETSNRIIVTLPRLRPWLLSSVILLLLNLATFGLAAIKTTGYQWAALALWIVTVTVTGVALLGRPGLAGVRRHLSSLSRNDGLALSILLAVAVAAYFFSLESYPMVVAGDPVRDTGLDVQRILDGDYKDFFVYGYINSYGLMATVLTSPIYLLLGPSALSFKVPPALLAIATIVMFFVLARRWLSTQASFIGSLALLCLPTLLFYGRYESLHVYNIAWMPLLFAATYLVLRKQPHCRHFGFLGLLSGVLFTFHGAIKAAAFASLGLAAIAALLAARREGLRWLLAVGLLTVVGMLIGFGPLILATTPEIFLVSNRIPDTTGTDLSTLVSNYWQSLRIFFDRPTTSWLPTHEPLLPFKPLAFLFAAGLLVGLLVVPRRLFGLCLFYLLVLLLTNSALTDMVNGEHRLMPLLPVVALVIAMACEAAGRAVSRTPPRTARPLKLVLWVALVLVAIVPGYRFFADEMGRLRGDLASSLKYFAIHEIESTETLRDSEETWIIAAPAVVGQYQLAHHIEGWEYYFPGRKIHKLAIRGEGPPNALFLSPECPSNFDPSEWERLSFCSPRQAFVCPEATSPHPELLLYRPAATTNPAHGVANSGSATFALPGFELIGLSDPSSASERPAEWAQLDGLPVSSTCASIGELERVDLAAAWSEEAVRIEISDEAFLVRVDGVFDGNVRHSMVSGGTNPLVITLTFPEPIRVKVARIFPSASPNDWTFRPHPSHQVLLAPRVPPDTWSYIALPEAISTSEVRFEVLRLERDNFVHLNEIELFVESG